MAGESAFGVPVLFELYVVESFMARDIASESIDTLVTLYLRQFISKPGDRSWIQRTRAKRGCSSNSLSRVKNSAP